uniref:Fucolectin tachylectin-4 pentraxin-1 domain-containing protein n=1 Tax=Pundamilia nyererei TaxID=303518 RepID=A0A3B4G9U0_9CICH
TSQSDPWWRVDLKKVYTIGTVLITSTVELENGLDGYPSPNLALKGEATQSSTLSFAAASKAIDGRRNSFYTNGFCSHTAEDETDPWWRVDLQHSFTITTVKVTNRGDCCAERLDGAEIRIGNSLENNGNNNPKCGTINSLGSSPTHTFQCNEMEGRYITVFLPGPQKILTMCEVEVFASLSAFPSPSQTTSGWGCAGTVLIM